MRFSALAATAALTVAASCAAAKMPVYDGIETLPSLVAAQTFFSAPKSDGNSKGMEFSSALEFSGKLLLSDDENDSVSHPALRTQDGDGYCLFELIPNASTGNFLLDRPWRAAFDATNQGDKLMDDAEGTTARGNTLYILGSHSYNNSGERKTKRETIARVRLGANGQTRAEIRQTDLRPQIVQLIASLPENTMSLPEIERELNIEALTIDPASPDLLIGLKRPLIGPEERALLLRLREPDAFFDGTLPSLRIEKELLLDADSSGFSSMEWDSVLEGFIIATNFKEKENDYSGSSLWLWKGANETPRQVCRFRNLALEGVARITQGPLAGNLLLAFDMEMLDRNYQQIDGGGVAVVRWGQKR